MRVGARAREGGAGSAYSSKVRSIAVGYRPKYAAQRVDVRDQPSALDWYTYTSPCTCAYASTFTFTLAYTYGKSVCMHVYTRTFCAYMYLNRYMYTRNVVCMSTVELGQLHISTQLEDEDTVHISIGIAMQSRVAQTFVLLLGPRHHAEAS